MFVFCDLLALRLFVNFIYDTMQKMGNELIMELNVKLEKKDWEDLRKMIDEKIPTFYSEIQANNINLQQRDYDLCILIRLYFTPADIGILTGLSSSNISMKRIRLLKRIFGVDGTPENFDKRIQSIC